MKLYAKSAPSRFEKRPKHRRRADGRRRGQARRAGCPIVLFVHTQPAIITDIEEIAVAELIDEVKDDLGEFNRMFGIWGWDKSMAEYKARLITEGFKAWSIDAAIGFSGYVVGRDVQQL
jgi:hypothetical protein